MVASRNYTKSTALAILGIALSQVAFSQMVRTDAAVSEKSSLVKSTSTVASPPALRTPRVTTTTTLQQAAYTKDAAPRVTQTTTAATGEKTAEQKPPLNPYQRSAATPVRWRRN